MAAGGYGNGSLGLCALAGSLSRERREDKREGGGVAAGGAVGVKWREGGNEGRGREVA